MQRQKLATRQFSRSLANLAQMTENMNKSTDAALSEIRLGRYLQPLDEAFRKAYDVSIHEDGYRWLLEDISTTKSWSEVYDLLISANFHSVVSNLAIRDRVKLDVVAIPVLDCECLAVLDIDGARTIVYRHEIDGTIYHQDCSVMYPGNPGRSDFYKVI